MVCWRGVLEKKKKEKEKKLYHPCDRLDQENKRKGIGKEKIKRNKKKKNKQKKI